VNDTAQQHCSINHSQLDDNTLMALAVGESDTLAFDEIVKRHRATLTRRMFRLFPHDAGLAEDAVQEGLLQAYLKRSYFSGSGSVEGWLWSVARQKAIDIIRKRRRDYIAKADVIGEVPENGGHALDIQDSAPLADELLIAAQEPRRRVTRKDLFKLPELERDMVHMAYFRGMSQADIARAVGKDSSAISRRIDRALTNLRRILSESCTRGLQSVMPPKKTARSAKVVRRAPAQQVPAPNREPAAIDYDHIRSLVVDADAMLARIGEVPLKGQA